MVSTSELLKSTIQSVVPFVQLLSQSISQDSRAMEKTYEEGTTCKKYLVQAIQVVHVVLLVIMGIVQT